MRRLRDARPTPALIVAVLALVAALAGTAVAEQATTSKVTTKKVKKIAKKQAKKQINKLAPGLSVASAARADSAAQVDTLQLDPENVPAAANQAAAPQVELLTYGPFTVYGKCFSEAANLRAVTYVKITDPGAVFDSEGDELAGGANGYLNPATIEENREISEAIAGANTGSGDEEAFDAVLGTTKLEGHAASYAKNGTPAAGNGTYGAGNRCIFDAFGTQTGA